MGCVESALAETVKHLKTREQFGAPLASFDRLYVNLETTGLFRWAWRIQSIQLDRPRATVEIRPDLAGRDRIAVAGRGSAGPMPDAQ